METKRLAFFLYFILIVFINMSVYAQRGGISFELYHGETDASLANRKIHQVRFYECFPRKNKPDSCLLRGIDKVDEKGSITYTRRGENLKKGLVDVEAICTQLSDSIFEINKTYLSGAYDYTRHPELFTFNNGTQGNTLRFPMNKDSSTVVTWQYTRTSNGDLLLRTFGLDKKQYDSTWVFGQALGSDEGLAHYDTVKTIFETTCTLQDSSWDKIIEVRSLNSWGALKERKLAIFKGKSDIVSFSSITQYIFDDKKRVIRENILNRDNTLSSEKIWKYANNDTLILYLEESTSFKVEKLWKENGQPVSVLYEYKSPTTKQESKYLYDKQTGLLIRENRFINSKLVSYLRYEYQ